MKLTRVRYKKDGSMGTLIGYASVVNGKTKQTLITETRYPGLPIVHWDRDGYVGSCDPKALQILETIHYPHH